MTHLESKGKWHHLSYWKYSNVHEEATCHAKLRNLGSIFCSCQDGQRCYNGSTKQLYQEEFEYTLSTDRHPLGQLLKLLQLDKLHM